MMEKKKESRLRFSQVKLASWLSNLRRRSTQPASTASEPNLSSVSDHSFHRKLNGTQDSDHNLRRISCIETEKNEAFAEFDFPRSSCGSCRSSISVNSSDFEIQNIGENRIPEPRIFSDMLSEIKRSREIAGKFKISLENKAEGRRSDNFKGFVSDSRSGKDRRGDRRRGKDENQRRGASRSAQIRMERKMEIKVCSPMREEKNAGVAGSFTVVKSSSDPLRDFRESMVEMISENRIEGPEELEDLLACYLSLNSDEYHDVIVKAFRLVWFELNRVCTG